jgi:hypothetical protein
VIATGKMETICKRLCDRFCTPRDEAIMELDSNNANAFQPSQLVRATSCENALLRTLQSYNKASKRKYTEVSLVLKEKRPERSDWILDIEHGAHMVYSDLDSDSTTCWSLSRGAPMSQANAVSKDNMAVFCRHRS